MRLDREGCSGGARWQGCHTEGNGEVEEKVQMQMQVGV